MTANILVVEDNLSLADGLRLNLEVEGHTVRVSRSAEHALTVLGTWRADLLVLDITLPGLDGFALLEAYRGTGADTPVLILSARASEADRLRGFREGADDYVVKPFSLPEFLARVAALLRRTASAAPLAHRVWQFDDVVVTEATREVTRRGVPVILRPREIDLLLALLRRGGQIATRAELLREVCGYSPHVVSRTIDVHMFELRHKLERDPTHPRRFVTVRKAGYRFVNDPVDR